MECGGNKTVGGEPGCFVPASSESVRNEVGNCLAALDEPSCHEPEQTSTCKSEQRQTTCASTKHGMQESHPSLMLER